MKSSPQQSASLAHLPIGIRWTIGDVNERGFQALACSIWGAYRIFGSHAAYAVCVNHVDVSIAQQRAGPLPVEVRWIDATRLMPIFLRHRFDENMAQGVGWKLAPLRVFEDRHEISLDNDCILWSMPAAMEVWLSKRSQQQCLMAQDVRACSGQFADLCRPHPRNAGIRGLPPGFDLEDALRQTLRKLERTGPFVQLSSELDEQGLQTAALSLDENTLDVTLEDVTLCSPFHPHHPEVGRCGAHFVGLNARHVPWHYHDRPADEWMTEHWRRQHPLMQLRVGHHPQSISATKD